MHTEGHAPPQTKLTFRKLPFHAQPYLMPRDTVANRAATKVLSPSLAPIPSFRFCPTVNNEASKGVLRACTSVWSSRKLQAMAQHARTLSWHTMAHSPAQLYVSCRAADSCGALAGVEGPFQGSFLLSRRWLHPSPRADEGALGDLVHIIWLWAKHR